MALFQSENLWIREEADGAAALVLDHAERSVNVLSAPMLTDLSSALNFLEDTTFPSLSIISAKKGNFIAGADITELSRITTSEDAVALAARGQELMQRIAALPTPTIAVINGPCLGGGFELALACDYRVAAPDLRVHCGLPEIELGLIPAWGGTQRLPRLIGLERALQVILLRKRIRLKEMQDWGVIDFVLERDEQAPQELLAAPVKRPRDWLPVHTWRQRLVESHSLGRRFVFRVTEKHLRKRVPDDMPAPAEALEAVRIGLVNGIDAGLKHEREAAGRLVDSTAAQNLLALYQNSERIRKAFKTTDEETSTIRRLGVVGAGAMGGGVIQLAALRGCEVAVQEINELTLGVAMLRVATLFEQAAKRGAATPEQVTKAMASVFGSAKWNRFDKAELVVEAVVEDLDAKRKVLQEIEKHVSDKTIIVTNTSSLRVQHLQQGLKRPNRLAGLHFFNPVHKMPLVEIACPTSTKADVAERLRQFVGQLGKIPIVVKDSPGFLVNRILMPYFNEAVQLLSEGCRVEQVDGVMRRFGMAMGPLEVLDEVGLDVAADIAEAVRPVFGDRLQPHPGLAELRDKGWLGKKTNKGFYTYRGKRKRPNHLAANTVRLADPTAVREVVFRDKDLDVARDRMVALTINEAVTCLGEQIVADGDTLNLAMVLGAGWAPHRGGPLQYVEDFGRERMRELLVELGERFGERFAVSEYWGN